MGTPGTVCSYVAVSKRDTLVVIDRSQDTWERTGEYEKGADRFAVNVEPSGLFKTFKHRNAAREEAARLSDLGVSQLANELRTWVAP